MFQTYQYPEFGYRQSEEQRTGAVKRHPMVVIGAATVTIVGGLVGAWRALGQPAAPHLRNE